MNSPTPLARKILHPRRRRYVAALLLTAGALATAVSSAILVRPADSLAEFRTPDGFMVTSDLQTAEALKLFSDLAILHGVGFNPEFEIRTLTVDLHPVDGLELPVGAFHASSLSFDPDGSLVAIELLDAAPPSSFECHTVATPVNDPAHPNRYDLTCAGLCEAPLASCVLHGDILTLELRCKCVGFQPQ